MTNLLTRQDLSLDKEDLATLCDMILDAFNMENFEHPVVTFIREEFGFPAYHVEDFITYMDAFEKPPLTTLGQALTASKEGPYFWQKLYNIYNKSNVENSLREMWTFINATVNN